MNAQDTDRSVQREAAAHLGMRELVRRAASFERQGREAGARVTTASLSRTPLGGPP